MGPPSSRKGEALCGIVTDRSDYLFAIPARASLGGDDNPVGDISEVCLVLSGKTCRELAALGSIRDFLTGECKSAFSLRRLEPATVSAVHPLVSRLRIAAQLAARSYGISETKGH